MYLVAAIGFSHYMFMVPLALLSVFLILVILVQRGRGGGLTGALGGMGGQSAFGTKAGDLFTRITIGVATVWILLCVISVRHFNRADDPLQEGLGGETQTAPAGTAGGATGTAPASTDTNGTPAAGSTPATGTTPASTTPATTPVEKSDSR